MCYAYVMERFADRLKKARESCRLSQTALAGRAGLHPSAISQFEAGRREPSLANLERLVKAMPGTGALLAGDTDKDTPLIRRVRRLRENDAELVMELLARFS